MPSETMIKGDTKETCQELREETPRERETLLSPRECNTMSRAVFPDLHPQAGIVSHVSHKSRLTASQSSHTLLRQENFMQEGIWPYGNYEEDDKRPRVLRLLIYAFAADKLGPKNAYDVQKREQRSQYSWMMSLICGKTALRLRVIKACRQCTSIGMGGATPMAPSSGRHGH